MSKEILYGAEARTKMQIGINKLADAVRTTIGPKGLNAVLGRNFGNSVITNDGVSIAKEIDLEDRFENLGAGLIRQVAEKTNDEAGDGTTTSTVLTQSLVNEGLKFVETGINAVGIRRGMDEAKNIVIEVLRKNAKKITSRSEIAQVATISAESEEMGELIASVMDEVGKDGVVTVEQSQNVGLFTEIVKGMSFDRGFVAPTDDLKEELEEPKILITDKKIHSVAQIINILNTVSQEGSKNILILAESFDDKMLYDMALNKIRGVINGVCVLAPEFAENKKRVLQDIAVVTGAKVITGDMKLEEATVDMLGFAQKVVSTRQTTTIIGGNGKKKDIQKRITEIKDLIKTSETLSDKDMLKKRLAKVAGGVGIIKVGAATETETTYLKHKLEDAIAATKAAVEEGIVIGGGSALVKSSNRFASIKIDDDEKRAGYKIVMKAIREPLIQIVKNAGAESPDVILHEVSRGDVRFGYDAKNGKFCPDMFKAGIIDPLRVTRMALENAVSIAALVLTTETAVVDKEEPKLAI